MDMRLVLAAALLVMFAQSAMAMPDGRCDTTAHRATPHGAISRIACGNGVAGQEATLLVDGVLVPTSSALTH